MSETEEVKKTNFIRQIIEEDIASGKHKIPITRFPPEPNGHLHIGHAKSICLNFGIARDFNSVCHLRLDDTNPEKESEEYAKAIIENVKWLGFEFQDKLFYASNYYEQLFNWACHLINEGKAYVCSLNAEQMREYRGDLKTPGKNSPSRDRSPEENLDLFKRMRAGEFEDGKYLLRAKIDMSHPNLNMRDPAMYRIKRLHHQRTGDDWPIYPMYDFAHGLSDCLEGITHSLCTLEFEGHRPLYDWFNANVPVKTISRQIEFSRLNLEYTIMSKRKLLQLVEEKYVKGWDDPRMPTLSGMRRRGYTPEAIVNFCESIGITKKDSVIALTTLEQAVRDDLNKKTKRIMGVIDPIKVIITSWEADRKKEIEIPLNTQDETAGSRKVELSNIIYIDRDDFMEEAPKKFFRLKPEGNVRLRFGPIITCDEIVKDNSGKVVELKCHHHEESFGGVTPEGMKKVKGIIHWVSDHQALDIETRIYDRLFNVATPGAEHDGDFLKDLNSDSLKVVTAKVEPYVETLAQEGPFQFERVGYFIKDPDSRKDKLILNRTITLRDTWVQK